MTTRMLDCLVSYFGLDDNERPTYQRHFCCHVVAGPGPRTGSGVDRARPRVPVPPALARSPVHLRHPGSLERERTGEDPDAEGGSHCGGRRHREFPGPAQDRRTGIGRSEGLRSRDSILDLVSRSIHRTFTRAQNSQDLPPIRVFPAILRGFILSPGAGSLQFLH